MAIKQSGFATSSHKLRVGTVSKGVANETYRLFAEVKDRYGNRSILNLNHGRNPYKNLQAAEKKLKKSGRGWIETVNGALVCAMTDGKELIRRIG